MAWISSSPLPYDTFASLGSRHGDTYTVGEDCLRTLQEILRKLAVEDITFRTFRRAISFGQNIRKDLIPLLIYVKDDTKITDSTKIIDTTIKILVNLTIPIEYLMSIEDVAQTDVGRHTIFELSQLLTSSKEAFTDSRSTKALIDHMKHVVERHSNLNIEQCDSINNCLLLLRNLLHIPEQRTPIYNCPLAHFSMQNQIIWNLFTQSIDKIIIYLISCPQKMYWGFTMVQLIALMYKDQHVGTLQKLLNLWIESSLSESSEDNESNTSPPQGSGDSSPIITSDPTSDSSDNGEKGQRNKNNTTDVVRAAQNRSKALAGMKRVQSTETETSTSSGVSLSQSTDSGIFSKGTQSQSSTCDKSEQMSCTPQQQQNTVIITNGKKCEYPSSQSEVSDCGYVTQVENQESISTSSNDDDQPHQKPIHQKPHTFQKTRYNTGKNRSITLLDKKELRRKKLVKRSKTNTINVKGLIHHLPTDEDITNILKEFTVDFLLKGYATLVHDLHSQLLSSVHVNIDTSHFFWLVTYFLKFATQLELDLEHIYPVLSYNILSYLVFQGVWLYEELEISYRVPNIDLKPCLRRLHLVVTAIREFLQTVKTYRQLTHISEEDCTSLNKLKVQICESEDLKCLFLLLLRQYNPKYQSKQYLQDLILTNHNYLLFLDNFTKTEKNPGINLMEHLKQFATVEIMHQYGILLEDFKENGEFVNNCIFTMMHHIGGDLEHLPTLFQPHILKTFSLIWETDYEICDDWADLIEYVINKFINTPRPNYTNLSDNVSPTRESEDASPTKNESTNLDETWTKEEKDNLLNYYNQSQNTHDKIANITMKYQRNGTKIKTQLSIITELLEQNLINENQYNDFMRCRKSEKENEDSKHKIAEMKIQTAQENLIDGDIRVLKEYLFRENKGNLILWLQKVLIEACFIKLVLANPEMYKNNDAIMEPTCYYYASINLPIPVVPWTTEQNNVVKHKPFILLLHKLGFYLPVDTGKIFVRIPNFWNADYIFSIAQQLGPIDPAKIKFDMKLLNGGFNMPKTELKNINQTRTFNEQGKFSMTDDVKETPSVVRYTPLPDSKECYQTYLQSRLTTFLETALHISTNQLSIAIPEINSVPCGLTPPELCIAEHASVMSSLDQMPPPLPMDCSPIQETLCILNDDIEHNSICETASVASDLMCVSDEEDKEPLVLDEEKK